MSENVTILGLNELNNALLRIVPQHFRGQVLQKALLAGAKPMVADAMSRVPVRTGTLRKAIYSYKDTRGSTTTFASRFIGVRTGKKTLNGHDDAYYWRWIEFGHGVIVAKDAKVLGSSATGFFGKSVRAYPAHPFLRPAFEATKQESTIAITRVLADELDNAANLAKWANFVPK